MNKTELRAEEDYFENLGLPICAGCEEEKYQCKECKHHYHSMYKPSKVITVIRESAKPILN